MLIIIIVITIIIIIIMFSSSIIVISIISIIIISSSSSSSVITTMTMITMIIIICSSLLIVIVIMIIITVYMEATSSALACAQVEQPVITGIFRGPLLGAPSIKAYMSLFSLMYTSILLNKAKYGGDLWVGEPRLVVDGLAQQHGVAQHLLLYVAVCVY